MPASADWQRECIHAYTDCHGYKQYPGYVNVSRCPNGDYEITVRSKESVSAGQLRIDLGHFLKLVEALKEEAHQRAPKK